MSKYSGLELEKIELIAPTETRWRGFSIGEIKMSDCYEWSIKLKFTEYFQTVKAEYNLVFAPSLKQYQDHIDSIVREYNKPQKSLDDVIDDPKLDPISRINDEIQSYNEAIKRMWVIQMYGELEKYERKSRTKDVDFIIPAQFIQFFAERYLPSDGWCVYLEPAKRLEDENGSIKEVANVYDVGDFINNTLQHENFLTK